MNFEWDEGKRQRNLAKHKVDFVDAQELLDGRPVVTVASRHPEEERFLTTGILEDRFYTVIWTWRGNVIRSSQQGGHAMKSDERIVRYTVNELAAMRQRGEGHTDMASLDAITDEELEASIDRAEEGEIDWNTIQVGIPHPKKQLTVRLDADVIEWFKAQGAGYQTRMNAVLRSFVEAQKRRSA